MQARLTDRDPLQLDSDLVLVPFFRERPLGPLASAFDAALEGAISRMQGERELLGDFPERTVLPTLGRIAAHRLLLLGLGRPEQLDGYRLRNAVHLAVRDSRRFASRVGVLLDRPLLEAVAAAEPLAGTPEAVVRAVAEAVVMGNHHLGQLKSQDEPGEVTELELVGAGAGPELARALEQGVALGEATNRARWLQWQPGNRLTPTDLAAEAERIAARDGLELELLERAEMERLGMGALLAVARGSHEPPKLVSLRYRPEGPAGDERVLALVGKGITFDTGGISLKPNAGMVQMKADMSGAAAVLEAASLIGQLRPGLQVLAVAALTENMPGGGATKPGDVVRAMNGKSIEINNTDAEGRLVLADALGFAASRGATHLVDVATLTGSAVTAVGYPVSAAMGTSPELMEWLRRAGALAGERIWPFPLYPEYDLALRSDIADMRNTSGTTPAGAINAAVFLRQFTSELPWAHLDIAGSAYHVDSEWARLVPRGPSGVMARTLAHLPSEMTGERPS